MEIVGFEVANVIVRVLNLRHSLLADDVAELQSEVLANEGVRALVSDDEYELWCIAAEDKRSELRGVAKEVARLGLMCVDTSWHNLKHDFDMLGTVEEPRAKLSKEEVEAELKNLNVLAEATAEKSVRLLKRRALWSKRFDSIVEKLAEAIHFLHGQILEVFGTDVVKVGALITGSKPSPSDMRKLGVNGLAHHYAHLVNYLDNLASLSLIARVLGTVGGSRTRTLGPMASRVGASDTDLARRREAADDVVRAEAAAARGGEGAAAVDKQAAVQRTKSLDPWDARKNLTRTGLFNPSGAAPLGSPRGILSQHGIGVGGSPAVVSPAAEPASDSPRAAAGAPAGAASPVASFGSSTRDSAVADPALLRGGPPMSPGVRNGLPSPLSRHSKRPGGNSRGSPRDTSSPRSSSGGSHAARSPSGPAPPGSPAAATAATASPTGHASGAAEAAGGAAPPAGGESAPGGSTRRSGTSLAEVRERRRARSMAKYHIMTPGGTPGN
eukprot:jgi/Mesen1/10333/ME000008S10113